MCVCGMKEGKAEYKITIKYSRCRHRETERVVCPSFPFLCLVLSGFVNQSVLSEEVCAACFLTDSVSSLWHHYGAQKEICLPKVWGSSPRKSLQTIAIMHFASLCRVSVSWLSSGSLCAKTSSLTLRFLFLSFLFPSLSLLTWRQEMVGKVEELEKGSSWWLSGSVDAISQDNLYHAWFKHQHVHVHLLLTVVYQTKATICDRSGGQRD